MAIRGYYLGCPGWATKTWVGRLFPEGTRPTELLARYARVFNTVEGNTTFYALPEPDVVARWRDDVPDDFRFCFKFPRTVSHDRLLLDAAPEVARFLERISPLGPKLGTLFLQLPRQFGPHHLDRLAAFLDALPRHHHYAVELRHDLFFAGGHEEDAAVSLLRERGIDLVIMDARGLHQCGAASVLEVRQRKPDLPVIMRATGRNPFVRCVPHVSFEAQRSLLVPWIEQVARWIEGGRTPYFFMHAPDDTYAPENANAFHAMLRERIDVGELPPWPVAGPRQLGLF
ncbi:MAG: DUF72 domain-containing protein [Deltaproteobacteria bacterium]|nr:DUF72 domain-containing protein [Deltaproteobacteria bacterium]